MLLTGIQNTKKQGVQAGILLTGLQSIGAGSVYDILYDKKPMQHLEPHHNHTWFPCQYSYKQLVPLLCKLDSSMYYVYLVSQNLLSSIS